MNHRDLFFNLLITRILVFLVYCRIIIYFIFGNRPKQTFIDERLLWPIAEDEINNNPAINQEDQNPGY
ncbi:hypothetical protein MNBD_BACTEROID01-2848 [hydrothermal vent metagenome]|uniref:Uncharacterized protein n=1 Tax=hydrothermal vent metagenome TaxID=652676 RepID=A0A3B0UAH5_9ZZZZ